MTHQIAAKYGQRPSDILGIEDRWIAYDLDMAVVEYGLYVENRLQEVEKKGDKYKPKWTLQQILSGAAEKPQNQLSALLLASGADVIDF